MTPIHGRVALTALLALVACAGEPPASGTVAASGAKHEDAVLERLLMPDRNVADAQLLKDERGLFTYQARLRERAMAGYAAHYKELLRSRGVLIRPIVTSPHAIPPRTLGYTTLVIAVAAESPPTLTYREFELKDPASPGRAPTSAPDPLSVEGSLLTLQLGISDGWHEEVILPDRDVADVKELPLPRYPGAILKRTWSPTDEELVSRNDVQRNYVVRGATPATIAQHYAKELERIGSAEVQSGVDGKVFWRGDERAGIVGVSVSTEPFTVIPGRGLSLDELRHLVPGLEELVPSDVHEFAVRVEWPRPEGRIEFLTPADQERYRQAAGAKERR